ncbi:MAG: DNA polymerase III subunit gamma/tau [Metamycoplasmataceae bacterium]
MSYKAFYRLYRPITLDEVVGQDNIIKTLRNILLFNKISHAYLFSGPRGTGKTSVAKIFANVINCIHSEKRDMACQVCQGNINNSLDIIEIDAASNNGVNEIRDLKEKISFLPTKGKYKIYIIDEVHMLSKGAFNALLKTLEEPPKHAIFIFATTEPEKIPLTILSRVQRYSFSRISKKVQIKQLKFILNKENIKYEENALKVIADLANGSLRDALSIIDQVNAFSNGFIQEKDINEIFGITSWKNLFDIISFLEKKDLSSLLVLFNKLVNKGIDQIKLISSLINFLKNFILFKNTNSTEILDFDDVNNFDDIKISVENAYYMIDEFVTLFKNLKYSENEQQLIEITFMKICLNKNENINTIKTQNVEKIKQTQTTTKIITNDFELINNDIKEENESVNEQDESNYETNESNYQTNELANQQDEFNYQEGEFANEQDEFNYQTNELTNQEDELINQQEITSNFSSLNTNLNIPINKEKKYNTDDILNKSTNILNEVNEDDDLLKSLNESLIDSQEIEVNKNPVFDTNEINALEKAEKAINSKSKTKEILDNSPYYFNNEIKNDKPKEEKIINDKPLYKNETENKLKAKSISQMEIINLFLLANKEEMLRMKPKFNSYKTKTDDEFVLISKLMTNVHMVSCANNFVLFVTEKQFILNELLQLINDPIFKKYILQIFETPLHTFFISKGDFQLAANLWKELKQNEKLPQPKTLPPLLVQSENNKNNFLREKGKQLFGKIFKS